MKTVYSKWFLFLGAKIVGVNCHFDPTKLLDCMEMMKEGLIKANLLKDVHLMVQPLAYHTPDASKQGFIDLPEFPFSKHLLVASYLSGNCHFHNHQCMILQDEKI